MNINPAVALSFLAQVTPEVEVGVLDTYTVGLSGGAVALNLPDATDIVVYDVGVTGTVLAWTLWRINPRSGVRVEYTLPATSPRFSPWWRNPEGKVVCFDRLYAVAVQMTDDTAPGVDDASPEDFKRGAIVKIIDAETLGDASSGDSDPHTTQLAVDDIVGYVEGLNGVWFQAWPEGLIMTPATEIQLDPQYTDATYTLRFVLLGRAAPETAWANATVYAAGAIVTSISSYLAEEIRYYCHTGHTAATVTNKPATGSDWEDFWTELQ
jgi:hypothetical protein